MLKKNKLESPNEFWHNDDYNNIQIDFYVKFWWVIVYNQRFKKIKALLILVIAFLLCLCNVSTSLFSILSQATMSRDTKKSLSIINIQEMIEIRMINIAIILRIQNAKVIKDNQR